MRGKLYSVGIGPGDPELLTLKAVRLLKECDAVAIPQGDNGELTAKSIVAQVTDLEQKEQLLIYMPMTKDMAVMDRAHRKAADDVEALRARRWSTSLWAVPRSMPPASTSTNC